MVASPQPSVFPVVAFPGAAVPAVNCSQRSAAAGRTGFPGLSMLLSGASDEETIARRNFRDGRNFRDVARYVRLCPGRGAPIGPGPRGLAPPPDRRSAGRSPARGERSARAARAIGPPEGIAGGAAEGESLLSPLALEGSRFREGVRLGEQPGLPRLIDSTHTPAPLS